MRRNWIWAGVVAALLAATAACGDDDTEATASGSGSASAPSDESTGDAQDGTEVAVVIGADALEVPEEIEAGPVTVSIEGEIGEYTTAEFSRVEPGTTEEAFLEGLQQAMEGEPFPDFFLNTAGAVADVDPNVILLEPGDYFVWTEVMSQDEGAEEEEGAPKILVASTRVTGDGGGDLPETDGGSIVATDYAFEVDVEPGEAYTFRNDSPEQFHHAVVFSFGDLDPAVVEENLPAFMEGDEDAPPPEAFGDTEISDTGGSGVFGPGLGGTFAAEFESGSTYAVVCFITDRSGGAPHVIQHGMFEVFTVD